MRSNAGKLALFLVCLSLACAVPELLAKKKDKAADSGPNEQKRAVQALNRLTFGPRPGDIQQVMAMGLQYRRIAQRTNSYPPLLDSLRHRRAGKLPGWKPEEMVVKTGRGARRKRCTEERDRGERSLA